MGATGVENGRDGGFEHDMHGAHAVKLNGRTYHFFPTATNSTTEPSGGLSYFTFDAQAAMILHANSEPGTNGIGTERVNDILLLQLFAEMMQHNPLCQELEQIGRHVVTTTDRNLLADINASMTYFEVAQITDDSPTGNRCIRIKLRGSASTSTIQMTSGFLEPVSYPLFFPYGEKGWSADIKDSLTFMSYLASRILMPEYNADGTPFTCPSLKDPNIRIHCNRFQAAARLKQVYLVDMVSRAIDYRLKWNTNNQDVIFGGENHKWINRDLHIQETAVEDDSRKTFLPSSFHGGKRHLKKLASNALAVVSEMGNPTVFVTLTCNPNWPEIAEKLLQGQTAFDREDIVCQVFKQKLDKILKNIRSGKYFGPHTVAYIIRVIEYQHRGMPHAHIVLKLNNVPTVSDSGEDATAQWIDEIISARMPPTLHGRSSEEDIRYRLFVETHMIHKCSIAANGCKDSPTCKCKRGYEDTAIQDKTTFDERGFPVYRRDFECDLDVVPHNRSLILDWDGHANTEYAGNTQCVLYLYKYLYKGAKKVKLRLTNAEDVQDDDEVTLYLRGRFLCAMDAMWRTLGYQTYPASVPAVQTITVKMPEMVQHLLRDRKSSDMLVYFNRPMQLMHLKYTELFATYIVTEKLSRRFHHEDMNDLNGYYIISIPLLRRDLYLQRRTDTGTTIIRMEMLYVTAGKVFPCLNSSIYST